MHQRNSQKISDLLLTIFVFRQEEHAVFESLQRNRVSNVSFAVCSAGEVIILAVMVGILKALHADASTENNTKAFSVLIAFSGGVWCTSVDCHSSSHPVPSDIYLHHCECNSLFVC